MTDVDVRLATPVDAAVLAGLMIEWEHERNGAQPSSAECEAYGAAIAEWMRRHDANVVCVIASQTLQDVGMAWLVMGERIPNLDQWNRLSAEIQSVYVTARLRGAGSGERMIDELCAEADRRGAERILVHSSRRAIQFYQRLDFTGSAQLLSRER